MILTYKYNLFYYNVNMNLYLKIYKYIAKMLRHWPSIVGSNPERIFFTPGFSLKNLLHVVLLCFCRPDGDSLN